MSIRKRTALTAGLLLLALFGCNLPRPTPTPGIDFPTPNLTMTALFSPGGILGTSTPPAATDPNTDPSGAGTPVSGATPGPVITSTSSGSSTPTVSGTGVIRANARFTATFLDTPPVLDGIWDEWTNAAYPARSVVYGANQRENTEDLEVSFRVGWDRDFLYLAVKVIDDRYVQNATGVLLYQGDSIEVQFDADLEGDLTVNSLNNDDFQLGISPGRPDTAGAREAYLWNPSNLAGARTDVRIAAVGGDGLYRVEIAIPWSLFGVTPEPGDQFGLSLNISDNDNPNENIQHTMISAVAGRTLSDPTTWGLLILGQ